MFERFTERARQVVVLAQEEARTLRHNYIGTEHILLGLLREQEGLAARMLASLGVTAEQVRGQVVRIVGAGEDVAPGQIPFTPRAKKVLQLALREALSLGHNYISTEHILLGLARENEGVAARILLDFDVDSETIRREVVGMLGRTSPTEATGVLAGPPGAIPRPMRDMDRSWLDFTPAEAFDLAMRLAPLSTKITFEVRPHAGEEPTFRVSCRLTGNDDALRELVALEAHGIRAVLDADRIVRLGHLDWSPAPDIAAPGDA